MLKTFSNSYNLYLFLKLNRLKALPLIAKFIFIVLFPSILWAGDIQTYFSNLSDGVSNQRVSQILKDVFQNKNAKPKLKLRGASGVGIYEELAPSVVLIITNDGIGTGSFIGPDNLIITNWHVVQSNQFVKVAFMPKGLGAKFSEAEVAIARVISLKKQKDLALLKLESWDKPLPKSIELASQNDIKIGLDTHAIGHPNGEYWTYTRGYISQYRPRYEWSYSENEKFEADVIQTQTPINPGNSGGPLINENGKLIGVNSFMGEGVGINFAVAFTEIEKLLSENPMDQENKFDTGCETKVTGEMRSQKNDGVVIFYDRNCNNVPDISIYYPDLKSGKTIIDHDDNEDGKVDGMIVDEGSDESWDYSFWDTNFDGKWDVEGIHLNGDINPSSFKEFG